MTTDMTIGLITCVVILSAAGFGLWIGNRIRRTRGLPPVPKTRIWGIMAFMVVLIGLFDPFRFFEHPPLFNVIWLVLKVSGAVRDMLPF